MSKNWYLSLDGRQLGPLPSEQVQRMAQRGQIKPETPLRPETQEEWLPAKTWPQLFSGSSAGPPADSAPAKRVVPKAKAISTTPPPVVTPATGTIPRGAPVEKAVVPVGAPVAPVGIPAGTVAPRPTVTATSPVVAPLGPVIVTDAPVSRGKGNASAAHEDAPPSSLKKKNRTPVMILGGLVLVVALAGGLLVAFNPFGGGEEKQAVAPNAIPLAVAAKGPEADPQGLVEEEPPATELAANEPAAVAHVEGENARSASQPKVSKLAAELQKKVKGWKSAAAGYQVRSVMSYRVTDVWLEKGEAGNPLVFVQVAVTNLGQAPLAYRGWNGLAAKDTSAILLDDEGAALALAPADEFAAERLKSVSIQPKESVTDTLVFAAPQGEIEKLRLILPQVTVNNLGAGVFALEIPAAMVSQERPTGNAEKQAGGLLAGKAGAPPREENEFERERRRLAESLGGDKEEMAKEPKANEPKAKEPKAAMKEEPDAEGPAGKKPAEPNTDKEAKPGEPNLKALIDTRATKPGEQPQPEGKSPE